MDIHERAKARMLMDKGLYECCGIAWRQGDPCLAINCPIQKEIEQLRNEGKSTMKLNYCPQCRVVYCDAEECFRCLPGPKDTELGQVMSANPPGQKLQPCRLLTNSSEYGQQTLRCGKCGKKIMWLGGNVAGPLLVEGWTCACPDCGVETRVSKAKATTETRDAM